MPSAKPAGTVDPTEAIVAITRQGVTLALQLQARLPGSVCYVPMRHRFALTMGAHGYERLRELFPAIWSRHRAIVCIMATGIVVRLIAPLLRHKTVDPAVVVLDERGHYVISLVSGHLGGANELARKIAPLLGARPVITTASDVQAKPAWDLGARDAGLEIENPEMLAPVTRAFLDHEPVWIYDPDGRLPTYFTAEQPHLVHLDAPPRGPEQAGGEAAETNGGAATRDATVGIWVSERRAPPGLATLELRPRNLVVGIGCNRNTPAAEILDLLNAVFRREHLSPLAILELSSIDLKADEPGLRDAAEQLDRPIRFHTRDAVAAVTVPNPSPMVAAHIGVQSVCEATALLGPPEKTLIVEKQKTANVTLAVARVISPSSV